MRFCTIFAHSPSRNVGPLPHWSLTLILSLCCNLGDVLEGRIINENLRCALAAFSRVRAWGQVAKGDAFSLVYAGVSYGLFNTALVTAHLPDGRSDFAMILDHAEQYFERRNVAWSAWYCDELLTLEERRRARILLATRGM